MYITTTLAKDYVRYDFLKWESIPNSHLFLLLLVILLKSYLTTLLEWFLTILPCLSFLTWFTFEGEVPAFVRLYSADRGTPGERYRKQEAEPSVSAHWQRRSACCQERHSTGTHGRSRNCSGRDESLSATDWTWVCHCPFLYTNLIEPVLFRIGWMWQSSSKFYLLLCCMQCCTTCR